MKIEELKAKYEKYKKNDALMDNIFELKEDILSSDSKDFLEFHYSFLKENSLKEGIKNMIVSFFYSEVSNQRDNSEVANFLLQKYVNENDLGVKKDIIKILGHLRSVNTKELIENEINSQHKEIRYSCIIALGWIGNSVKDVKKLNDRMLVEEEAELRGYCATAMRQIWYNKKTTKNAISKSIAGVIVNENKEKALVGMIITIQDLYKKKFGIKESNYGDISGDVFSAKDKCVKFLNKL